MDIEDMNADDSPRSTPDGLDGSGKSLESPHGPPPGSHMQSTILSPAALASGHVPIRPTPFSALAAAAVAWTGMGGGVPWPGTRQMPPFGPPGMFPGAGFGGGKCRYPVLCVVFVSLFSVFVLPRGEMINLICYMCLTVLS